eukprot:263727-Pelagomonas_calceolata.AAC.4
MGIWRVASVWGRSLPAYTYSPPPPISMYAASETDLLDEGLPLRVVLCAPASLPGCLPALQPTSANWNVCRVQDCPARLGEGPRSRAGTKPWYQR